MDTQRTNQTPGKRQGPTNTCEPAPPPLAQVDLGLSAVCGRCQAWKHMCLTMQIPGKLLYYTRTPQQQGCHMDQHSHRRSECIVRLSPGCEPAQQQHWQGSASNRQVIRNGNQKVAQDKRAPSQCDHQGVETGLHWTSLGTGLRRCTGQHTGGCGAALWTGPLGQATGRWAKRWNPLRNP